MCRDLSLRVYNISLHEIKRFCKDLKLTRFAFDVRQSFEAVSRALKWFPYPFRHTYSGDVINMLLSLTLLLDGLLKRKGDYSKSTVVY